MIQRTLIGTGLIGLMGLTFGVSALAQQTSIRLAPAPRQTPAQMKAVFTDACGRCHPIERVTAIRRTKAQWEETINQMVTSRGATLTSDQYDTVLKYLVSQYGTTTPAQTSATPTPTPTTGRTPGAAPPPRTRAASGAGADDKMVVDDVAAARGRTLYAAGCIQCHGTTARGSDRGANLVRSLVVLHDRYGNELGPFLRKGHPTQSGPASAAFTDAQVADLSHFLHEKLNDTLRGAPGFTVQNILTGDKQAGAAYFDGAGGCRQCHSPTGDLAGIGKRYDPPALQQRFLFPRPPGRGPRGPALGGGASAAKQVTVTVTPASGASVTGVLINLDDFTVSLRDDSGQYRSWKRTPQLTVVKHDPYAAHVAMLDTFTDKNIHDVVAYLESLK
jgi:cytochrome c oxidase cbb3-type subunit III